MPFKVLISVFKDEDTLISVHKGEIWYPMDETQLARVCMLVMADGDFAVASLHCAIDGHIVTFVIVEVAK